MISSPTCNCTTLVKTDCIHFHLGKISPCGWKLNSQHYAGLTNFVGVVPKLFYKLTFIAMLHLFLTVQVMFTSAF